MDFVDIREKLLARRSSVVDSWFRGIANTSFAPRPLSEVRARLDELTTRAIGALLTDPLPTAEANEIGASLAELHYLNAQAAAATVRCLGHGLTAEMSREEVATVQPRLVDLLAEIIGGYYAASRQAILKEQDEVRDALFVTRQQAEAADEARSIAEASARARSDLLGHVAHDLRSPLTSIKGQSDLLAQRLDRDEAPSVEWIQSRVNSIRAAADRMQGMIRELLDAARLQVGEQLDLNLAYVDVVELVRRAVHAIEMSGRTVRLDVGPEPIMSSIDGARFERVMHNLLSNAMKYSAAQSAIDVSVGLEDGKVRVLVRDYGFGIPPDELPNVTTPFYRASTARAVPGIGLGLAGVKAIVDQHGGNLSIESAVNEGTTVTITLPQSH